MRRRTWQAAIWGGLALLLAGGLTSPAAGAGMHGAGGHGAPHGHDRLEVPAGAPVPTLAVTVERDAKAGWNVRLVTTNFRFAPEHASGPHIPGEGHAHLFVDGKKVARLYCPWYHLEGLRPGRHEIRATLNANTHAELAVGGRVIEAVVAVTVEGR